MIDERRLFNNLLTSQSLCFNFWGEAKMDFVFARDLISCWIDGVAEVTEVFFEYAPKENYTTDNSAFDIAIGFKTAEGRVGLFGLECKYTDNFSRKAYGEKGQAKEQTYRGIYDQNRSMFIREYDEYADKTFNQLFRNQLIAASLVEHKHYDFVITGLFCHQDDEHGKSIGTDFQKKLGNGSKIFKIITYEDFIRCVQKLEIGWERRQWSMLLWARYCGTELSKELSKALK
jgi:hypothetical protein